MYFRGDVPHTGNRGRNGPADGSATQVALRRRCRTVVLESVCAVRGGSVVDGHGRWIMGLSAVAEAAATLVPLVPVK
jgi:hypothetical protein